MFITNIFNTLFNNIPDKSKKIYKEEIITDILQNSHSPEVAAQRIIESELKIHASKFNLFVPHTRGTIFAFCSLYEQEGGTEFTLEKLISFLKNTCKLNDEQLASYNSYCVKRYIEEFKEKKTIKNYFIDSLTKRTPYDVERLRKNNLNSYRQKIIDKINPLLKHNSYQGLKGCENLLVANRTLLGEDKFKQFICQLCKIYTETSSTPEEKAKIYDFILLQHDLLDTEEYKRLILTILDGVSINKEEISNKLELIEKILIDNKYWLKHIAEGKLKSFLENYLSSSLVIKNFIKDSNADIINILNNLSKIILAYQIKPTDICQLVNQKAITLENLVEVKMNLESKAVNEKVNVFQKIASNLVAEKKELINGISMVNSAILNYMNDLVQKHISHLGPCQILIDRMLNHMIADNAIEQRTDFNEQYKNYIDSIKNSTQLDDNPSLAENIWIPHYNSEHEEVTSSAEMALLTREQQMLLHLTRAYLGQISNFIPTLFNTVNILSQPNNLSLQISKLLKHDLDIKEFYLKKAQNTLNQQNIIFTELDFNQVKNILLSSIPDLIANRDTFPPRISRTN